jgi:solute carrier family 25 carnitine/acylcarnitine transporter 20/29
MTIFEEGCYYFTGGILAGIAGTFVSQPFDTCKVYKQKGIPINFNSRTLKQNILWAYRGGMPSFIGYGIEKALIFGTYKTTCCFFDLDDNNYVHSFSAGVVSGLVASMSITVMEQLKTDKQLRNKTQYNFKHLYKGLKYTAMREGVGFGFYFTTYNQLSNRFNKFDTDSFGFKIAKSGAFGACSAFVAWIPIYPIDLIKTRIQSGENFSKIYQEFQQLSKFNKFKFMYKGYHYGMMRAIPFHATCFIIFEILKHNKN